MTYYAPVLITPPADTPVSLDDLRRHIRGVEDEELPLLEIYLQAAVDHLDGLRGQLRRALVTQTWAQSFDTLTSMMPLGLAPVSAVVVTYIDADGLTQTVDGANYVVENAKDRPVLRFNDDYSIPIVRDQAPAVTVTMTAGYGEPASVPGDIRAAILMLVADMFMNREAMIPGGQIANPTVRHLLISYRRGWAA